MASQLPGGPSLKVERAPALVRTQVLENLRNAICELRFKPGQRLVERELEELCGVSRTSIREALRELAAEGLVTTIPNRGMVVASVSIGEAQQLYELRSCLEGMATRLFVERAKDPQVQALKKAVESVKRAVTNERRMLAAKDRFYEILFAGAQNEPLRNVISSLHARVSLLRATSLSQPGRAAEAAAEIEAILAAVVARDVAEAEKRSVWHVEQAGRASIRALESQD